MFTLRTWSATWGPTDESYHSLDPHERPLNLEPTERLEVRIRVTHTENTLDGDRFNFSYWIVDDSAGTLRRVINLEEAMGMRRDIRLSIDDPTEFEREIKFMEASHFVTHNQSSVMLMAKKMERQMRALMDLDVFALPLTSFP